MKSIIKKTVSLLMVIALMVACFVIAPVAEAATYNAAFSVESKTVNKGDSFTVNINFNSNPGVTMLRLYVEYDKSILTLTKAEDKGVLGDCTISDKLDSPVCFVWANGIATEDYTVTGTIATLTFTASNYGLADVKVYTKSTNDILNSNLDLDTIIPTFTNGTVNVVPEEAPVLKFDRGLSMDIKDTLMVNYLVSESLLSQFTDPYVVFEMNGSSRKVSSYTVSSGVCSFGFSNIAPDYMTDTITATIYAKYNGVDVQSVPVEYSIVKYCQLLMATYSYSQYPEMNRLIVDLLNYGSALQVYNNRKVDTLANAILTETQKGYATPDTTDLALNQSMSREEMGDNFLATEFQSVAVLIRESVGMEYVFKSDIAPSELKVRVERNNGYVDFSTSNDNYKLTYTGPDGSGKYTYSVKYRGISATGLRVPLYFTVYQGSEPVSYRVCTSVEAYAKLVKGYYGEELDNLIKQLMYYGDSADAYNKTLGGN